MGDRDLVLPRLEDLDRLRFPIFRLPPPTFVVSVASQSLLMLSNVSVFPLLLECFAGEALLLLFVCDSQISRSVIASETKRPIALSDEDPLQRNK